MKMHAIQERLERDEYEVDPHKVADAIMQRLQAGRSDEASERPQAD